MIYEGCSYSVGTGTTISRARLGPCGSLCLPPEQPRGVLLPAPGPSPGEPGRVVLRQMRAKGGNVKSRQWWQIGSKGGADREPPELRSGMRLNLHFGSKAYPGEGGL